MNWQAGIGMPRWWHKLRGLSWWSLLGAEILTRFTEPPGFSVLMEGSNGSQRELASSITDATHLWMDRCLTLECRVVC